MSRKVTTVYKVVRRVPSYGISDVRLKSAISTIPHNWQVTYIPGKWVAPSHVSSLLFAFTTKGRAQAFRSGHGYEVWRADAEVATKRSGFWQVTNGMAWMASSFRDAKVMLSFWRRKTRPNASLRSYAPGGTVGCRRIRLVKKVS